MSKSILLDDIKKLVNFSEHLPKKIIYKKNFNFEELKKSTEKDLKIDIDNLTEQQSKNPVLYHRYLRILLDFIAKRKFYNRIMNKLVKLKYEFYKNYYDFSVEKKTEVDVYVKGDDDILIIQSKLDDCEDVIQYLNNICDRFKTRSFEISNIIKWEMFQHGE